MSDAEPSVRIGIVDVGTNTTRLLIADVAGGRVGSELVRISRVTRLGAGVDRTGVLAQDAIARELEVLDDYRELLERHRARRRVAVMTSAVRDAANGGEFAEDVGSRYGLDVNVLTGDEEAQLTYLGATDELDEAADSDAVLVLDIGGGSTELVLGRGRHPGFHVSTQAGVVRQADRHIHSDPPSPVELEAVALDVRGVLSAAVPPERRTGVGLALAVAGTPTSVAAIAQELEPYDPARVHGFRLTAATRDQVRRKLEPLALERRRNVPGLHPDRAITILPGIVILTEVMTLFGLGEVRVSEHDILRGAALAFSGADDQATSTAV